jgi:hypothetical protein
VTRERDRYRKASWGEQAREAILDFWRNRTARIIAVILLSGFLVVRLTAPSTVTLSDLAVGDCIYLRPPGIEDLAADAAQVAATVDQLETFSSAERAACNLSHSHEVSAAFTTGAASDPYPGFTVLLDRYQARCPEAFAGYVGHPEEGSRFATALAVPSVDTWAGQRYGLCLVFNADRTFLDHQARGSGE